MNNSPHNSPEDGSAGKTSGRRGGRFWRLIFSLILAFIVLGVLPYSAISWYNSKFASGAFRYRITVEVQVDDTVQTGSGVLAASFSIAPKILPGMGFSSRVRGEAVVVDIGDRGALFLLLKGRSFNSTGQYLPYNFFKIKGSYPAVIRGLADMEARGEIPFERLPMLVRFRDISDPKTVELVDPNDLAASFGPGVNLKRVTIETTKDPVTTGIDERLVWLGKRQIEPGVRRRGLLTGDEDLVPGKPGIRVRDFDFKRRIPK